MLNDKYLILFDDEDISGVATTETTSTNVFNSDGSQKEFSEAAAGDPILLNAAINDLGRAGRAKLNVSVGSTGWYCTGGTGTVDIKVYEHTAAAVASGTAVISVNIPGIVITAPAAHVVAGKYLFGLVLPPDLWGDTTNYFIGLSALVNTQTLTAGTLNAWISDAYA